MYQDLIIILGIIYLIYKFITHKSKLSLARTIYTFSLALGFGIFFIRNLISPFTMLFWWIFCMGISLVGMYFMLENDEFESDKVEKYHFNFKAGVYVWLFLVALYIYLYILTYY